MSAAAEPGRPRLLLVPAYTEVEWGILDDLETWAEVAAYDPPGVGSEPLPDELQAQVDLQATTGEEVASPEEILTLWREGIVSRGLAEIERRGWRECFVVADFEGLPSAVRLAARRPEPVRGIALGHAALTNAVTGERPTINPEIWAAFSNLLQTDAESFIRYGIAQMTRGSVSEELAEKMIARFPNADLMALVWRALGAERESMEPPLRALDKPLLLAEHEGCIMRSEEAFGEIVAAFPDARAVSCPEGCSTSPVFAETLRAFCEEVAAGD